MTAMPYLSRIWINPLRRHSQRLLAEPQSMHAAVLGGLSTQPVNERVLWRVDADEPRRPGLLVLTRSRPSWEHLIEQAGWPGSDQPQDLTRDYTPLLARVAAGREFAFRLTANPVQARRNADEAPSPSPGTSREGKRSSRLGHRTVAHQLRWLLERTSRWGFSIPAARVDGDVAKGEVPADVRITARARRSFTRKRGQPPVVIQVVTYEGRLVVTDADELRDRLLNGFGPAKAYGCGLLTLAPLGAVSAGDSHVVEG